MSRHSLVAERDVDDIGEVGRVARDDERLCKREANDLGGNLHGLNLTARHGIEIETTYATTSASSRPDTRPAGITPLPC